LQLLFAFIVLSTITISALLLIMLSKNSRSGKVRNIALQHDWQYEEFVNFSDDIKIANFGLLNYSQNVIFRHFISGDIDGHSFSFFDCRAIEPSGIHNSSLILFHLKLQSKYQALHASITPTNSGRLMNDAMQSPLDKNYLARLRRMQKISLLAPHYAFENHQLHANNPSLLEQFLQQHLEESAENANLSAWFLAHPHLHIEISNGMLLAYQPNRLLDEESIIPAINAVNDISKTLSNTDSIEQ